MAEITGVEAIRQAVDEELARDPNTFVIGEDNGGRFGRLIPGRGGGCAAELAHSLTIH